MTLIKHLEFLLHSHNYIYLIGVTTEYFYKIYTTTYNGNNILHSQEIMMKSGNVESKMLSIFAVTVVVYYIQAYLHFVLSYFFLSFILSWCSCVFLIMKVQDILTIVINIK